MSGLPKFAGGGTNAETLQGIPVQTGTPSDNDVLTYDAASATWQHEAGGGGTISGASNVGTAGVGIYKDVSAGSIRLKKINAGSAKVTVTDDVANDEVDIDISISKSDVGLSAVTNDSQLTRAAGDFGTFTAITTGAAADIILVEDTDDSNKKKSITVANLAKGMSHTDLADKGTTTHANIDIHVGSTSNPHSVTKTQVGLGNVTDDSQLKRAAGDMGSFTAITAAASADIVLVEDTDDGNNKKSITVGNLAKGMAHTDLSSIGTNSHTTIDSHIANVTTNPHSVTKTNVGLGNVTDDAQLKRSAGDMGSFTAITTGASADIVLIEDTDDGNAKKSITVGNLAKGMSHTNLADIGTTTHSNIDIHVGSTSNPHSVTKTQVGLGNVTDDSQLKRAAGDMGSFTAITTGASADIVLVEDTDDGNAKKSITVGNLAKGMSHTNLADIGTTTHSNIDIHVGSTSNPHSVTKTQVSLGNVTDDAQLKRSAADWSGFGNKATPVSADYLLIEDSADGTPFTKKYITWSQLPHLTVKEEGGAIDTDVTEINFVGASVTVTSVSAGKVLVTVSDASNFFPKEATTQTIAISTVSARSTELTVGKTYIIWSSVDCHIRTGTNSVTAISTDPHILARASFEFTPAAGETYVAVLQSTILPPSSAGYLTIFQSIR